MARTATERGLIDPSIPVDGTCGIYATDEGMVQLVSEHEGIKRVIEFSPDEWDQVAIGGIKLGVIARSAVQAKQKIQLPPIGLSPERHSLISKVNGKG